MLNRILFDELDCDGDIRILDNEPFTGIAYELFEDGCLSMEYEYKAGLTNNVCKDWYPNGQLEEITECKFGLKHGSHKEFFDDGKVKVEAFFEWSIQLERKEWSNSGDLIEDWKLDPNDPNSNYDLLLHYRKMYCEQS